MLLGQESGRFYGRSSGVQVTLRSIILSYARSVRSAKWRTDVLLARLRPFTRCADVAKGLPRANATYAQPTLEHLETALEPMSTS